MAIKNRIKELRIVKASDLRPNAKNWHDHTDRQRQVLRGLLDELGFAGAVLAREATKGRGKKKTVELELIDGHERAEIAGDDEIPVLVLDVTKAEADKLLATFDRVGQLAETNDEKLSDLASTIDAEIAVLQEFLDEMILAAPVKLGKLSTKPPPKMSWVLLGIPTVRFGEVAETVLELGQLDDVILETTIDE